MAASGSGNLQISPTASADSALREFVTAFRNWGAVISYLMVQYIGQSARRGGRLAFVMMLAEPLIMIMVLYFIRGVVKNSVSAYGTSYFVFLASGVFPYYMFIRTASVTRRGGPPVRPLPRITSLDIFIADTAANTLIWILSTVIVFYGAYLYGIKEACPDSIIDCAIPFFLLVLAGAGFGLINTSIARYFPIWPLLIGSIMRGMMYFAGVIKLPEFFSPYIRDWVVWNPMLHGVEWFRVGVYPHFPALLLDRSYLVICAVILFLLGVILDRATLRRGGR